MLESANISWTAHGLSVNDPVAVDTASFGFSPYQNYYVKTVPDANTITIAKTVGGTAIVATGAGSFSAVRQPTLNLNGTGAIPIRGYDTVGIGLIQNNTPPKSFVFGFAQATGLLTYDKLLNAWVKWGADISSGSAYMRTYWPPEIFLRLCQVIGAHPWIISPAYTLDGYTDPATGAGGITDWMPNFMTLIRDNYQNGSASWMVPRIEIHNELWNNGSAFHGTWQAKAHAYVYSQTAGWSANSNFGEYAGKVSSVLGQAANAVFGGAVGTKYWMITGVQTFSFSSASGAANNAERMTSSNYVAQSTIAQAGYTKSAASNWNSHIAITQYVTPGYNTVCSACTSLEDTLSTAFAGGVMSGNISGSTLTVTGFNSGPNLSAGAQIFGPGIPDGTTIASGGPGTTGTYTLSSSLTIPVGDTRMMFIGASSDPAALTTFVDGLGTMASFTGTISGTTLTATSVTGNIVPAATNVAGTSVDAGGVGHLLIYSGAPTFVFITRQLTGTPNGAGTYQLDQSITLGSTAMTSVGPFSVPASVKYYQNAFTNFAQAYTNRDGNKLVTTGYEGGYSPDYTDTGLGRTALDVLKWAGKNVSSTPNSATGLYGYLQTTLTDFKNSGGQIPSLLVFTGVNPSNQAWAANEDIYNPVTTTYWTAYKNWNYLLKRDLNPASNDNDPMWLEKAS